MMAPHNDSTVYKWSKTQIKPPNYNHVTSARFVFATYQFNYYNVTRLLARIFVLTMYHVTTNN